MEAESIKTLYGKFPGTWRYAELANICEEGSGIQTGPFGSQLHQRDYVASGTPIITVEHLGENRIIHNDLPRVSDKDRERLSRYSLHCGDVVFSRVGSVDLRALVRKEEDGWLFSGRCLRVRPKSEIVDSAYLSWFFGLPAFREYVRNIAFGATMPSLNTKLLSELPVYFPPLLEQRAIAHILGALDDKIELNRQMNQTLEAMAQALFKSWFVDFEPFRDQGMQDSPLGEIPVGWRVAILGDICEIIMGQSPPGETYNELSNGIPFYQGIRDFGPRFPARRVYCTMPTRFADREDVLLSVRAPVGSLNVTDERCAIGRGLAALRSRGGHRSYLYYLLAQVYHCGPKTDSKKG